MKPKNFVTIVLLLIVIGSAAFVVVTEVRPRGEDGVDATAAAPPASTMPAGAVKSDRPEAAKHLVIAYYFHRTTRCRTCRTIEAQACDTLTAAFPDALASGQLEWRVLNMEEPENEHFVSDFGLTSPMMVLVEVVDGARARWRALEKVWEHVWDKEAFGAYIRDETRAYLEGTS